MWATRIEKIFMQLLGVILSIAFLFPIYVLAINSFKPLRDIYKNAINFPETWSVENYIKAFDRLNFFNSFTNSLKITGLTVVIIIFISSLAAWALVRYKTKASNVIFMIFASAMLIPFQCVMLPLVRNMGQLHLLNTPGLIFMYQGFGCSMAIILFHGFIKNIPLELEEAATIDGCGMFRRFFCIVLPLLKPIIVTVAILNVMSTWNDYLLPSLVINKEGIQTLPLKTFLFFGQFAKKWDLATAGLVMCMIPIIIFYLCCQKYIVKGVTEGAVKG